MACLVCGSEEVDEKCLIRSRLGKLCNVCCTKNQSWNLCDTNCDEFPTETSSAPIMKGVELTCVSDGRTHKFVEDLFLPNIYTQYYCDVLLCHVNIFDPNQLEIDLVFRIKERQNTYKEQYLKDQWKKEENPSKVGDLVPILQVYTFEHGKTSIVPNSFSINDHPYMKIEISSSNYRTWQPYSKAQQDYIDVKGRPEFKEEKILGRVIEGEGFFGKNDTIWSELLIDKDYKITLSINYSDLKIDRDSQSVKIPFGLYFPFSLVNFKDYRLHVSDTLRIKEESQHYLIIPKQMRDEQLFGVPLEGNMNFIDGGGHCKHDMIGVDSEFHYDHNCIFHHNIQMLVESGFTINSTSANYPVMTGLYKSMKRLYNSKYAPCNVNVINASNKLRKVKVVSKIKGLSNKDVHNINIKPFEYKSIPVLPSLNEGRIRELNEITTKEIEIDVYENGKRIHSESHEVIVHPIESFIYNFENTGGDFKTYLYQLLGCYCTPHTREIEKIISLASKDCGKILGTLSNKYEQIMRELEAIYNVLSEDMNYVTRSLNFSLDNMTGTQRVSLPSTTLRLKSGNCIDLSLLLASAFESCKHEVELVLIPGHAFLSVNVTGMRIYIEATCLGNKSFQRAIEIGNQNFDKYFNAYNQPKDSNSRFVSIKLARESGILPFE